jgi:hypothetical protein
MHFQPIIIDNLFTLEEHNKIKELIQNEKAERSWNDKSLDRNVKKYSELDSYFSKILEPKAKKIFSDNTLKSTYSVYLLYDRPQSKLTPHKDNNACTYTIDYCLTAKTPWGVVVEEEEYIFGEFQGLAFMGGYDSHWRDEMPDPENNVVEVIMFHFCPEDHWYFTEGPDYVYTLKEAGLLDTLEVDPYELSPEYLRKKI